MRATALSAAAALVVICGPALAQEEPPEQGTASEVKQKPLDLHPRAVDLRFQIVDLVSDSAALVGAKAGLDSKPAKLEAKVEALEIQETATEITIQLSGDILFDFDKATLRPAAEPVLGRVAEVIKKQGKPMVRIDGHTDSKGNDDYNMKLSQKRAESVKDWLVGRGAVGGVLYTKGLGETKPAAPNENPDGSDNPDGRQKNRRVEIVVKKM